MYEPIRVVNGPFAQNCYLLRTESSTVCIDPGSEFERIRQEIEALGNDLQMICNTHGHFDHIGAVAELIEEYRAPFYIHKKDKRLVRQANLYQLLFDSKKPIKIPKPSDLIEDARGVIKTSDFILEYTHTPGHTPGSLLLQWNNSLFVGDLMTHKEIGRIDLPGGNRKDFVASLQLLLDLDSSLVCYPGHGRSFLLGDGKAMIERYVKENQNKKEEV